MDRIDHLRIFLRIAESGSFSQAADQLGLPRATASLAMQQLERRLGARLLHRTTRKVSLTLDGEALLDRAATLIADMDDLENQFRPNADAITGRLKIDVPSRIARRLIAPRLQEFLERYPGVDIDLGSTDQTIDLVQEGVDCALRMGSLVSSSLVARRLGEFELINCASPAYLAEYGEPQSPYDLGTHYVVDYLSPANGRAAPWEWLEHGELRTAAPAGRVSANNAETYIACALAGLGMIQIPAFDVQDHLLAGELVDIMPTARPGPMSVNFVYPHRRHLSLRLQAFSQWLEGLLAPHMTS